MRYIDLSHTFYTGMPQYPGHSLAHFDKVTTVKEDGEQLTKITSLSHVGTHCDAPSHFFENGMTSDAIPVEDWIGWASVINLSSESPDVIEARHLLKSSLCKDEGVLIATGHSKFWGKPEFYEKSPYISVEAAKILRESEVKFIGIDFGSPDPIGSLKEPCHHILLGANILIIECLNNLDKITKNKVWFCGAPIKIYQGDGGFTRAFALEGAPFKW